MPQELPAAKSLSKLTSISTCTTRPPRTAAYFRRSKAPSDEVGKLRLPTGRRLQELIRIDIDRYGYVFGEWQFIEGFTDEPAQTHDGLAANQDVKLEVTL